MLKSDDAASGLLAAINDDRAASKLAPLASRPILAEAAARHAADAAKSGNLSAPDSDGLSHFDRIAKAYLIGEAAPAFAATLGEQIPYEISGSLDVAVENAAREAGEGGGEEVVLLSPACASFDQFRNFEVRGEAFRKAVAELPGIEIFAKG